MRWIKPKYCHIKLLRASNKLYNLMLRSPLLSFRSRRSPVPLLPHKVNFVSADFAFSIVCFFEDGTFLFSSLSLVGCSWISPRLVVAYSLFPNAPFVFIINVKLQRFRSMSSALYYIWGSQQSSPRFYPYQTDPRRMEYYIMVFIPLPADLSFQICWPKHRRFYSWMWEP